MTVRSRSLALATATRPTGGDGRTVRVRLVAWDTPSTVSDDGGRTWYQEQFARGGLVAPPRPLPAAAPSPDGDHSGDPVGRIVATDELEDGLYADVRVADTAAGRDLLALVDDELVSVSAEFDDVDTEPADGELVTRTAAELTGLAFTHHPQHTTAAVLGRRSLKEKPPMDDELDTETTDATTTDELDTETTDETTAPDGELVAAGHARSLPARRPNPQLRPTGRTTAPATASRFRSFGHFARAAAEARGVTRDERNRFYRALANADSSDITGLTQVAWIADVIDLVAASQPTVQAFSSRPLPEDGLTVQQPIVTTRPSIGKQATQGDAVSSTAVVIGHADWTINTYGGGQGFAIQTILRSKPAYLDEVMRLYTAEMASELEEDVSTGLVAAANDTHTAVELSNTANEYQDAFVDACALVLGSAGLGRMPEVAVLNVKMWQLLAKAKDSTGRPLFPSISPFNPQGSLDLTSTSGEIRSLSYVVAPKMANVRAQAVVGVRDAYRTSIGAMQTMQADVPETLTQEKAVFEFAAHGAVDTRGLVLIDNAS